MIRRALCIKQKNIFWSRLEDFTVAYISILSIIRIETQSRRDCCMSVERVVPLCLLETFNVTFSRSDLYHYLYTFKVHKQKTIITQMILLKIIESNVIDECILFHFMAILLLGRVLTLKKDQLSWRYRSSQLPFDKTIHKGYAYSEIEI